MLRKLNEEGHRVLIFSQVSLEIIVPFHYIFLLKMHIKENMYIVKLVQFGLLSWFYPRQCGPTVSYPRANQTSIGMLGPETKTKSSIT